MKINDQGFTERLSPQTSQTGSANGSTNSTSTKQAGLPSASPDSLQLSNLAARLQANSGSDASRSERLSQIAQAVRTNTFQVNAAQVSGAIISEAIQTAAH